MGNPFASKETFEAAFKERAASSFGRDVKDLSDGACYMVLGHMVKEEANIEGKACKESVKSNGNKQLVYFSMEFLLGRLLRANLVNLGVLEVVKEGLATMGRSLDSILEQEPDAGLGNGGLGRLAACFMDSIASLGLPGHGNTLRYDYGFFRQVIRNGKQEEVPDLWLLGGNVWETRKPSDAVEVQLYGYADAYVDPKTGYQRYRTANAVHVTAIPCDMDIIGYHNSVVNTLRLWTAEPSNASIPSSQDFGGYLRFVKDITHCLYPDDSTEEGRLLRLRQEYFLASAGIQSAVRKHKALFGDVHSIPQHWTFHLNDSHPIIAIPELMRILIDEEGLTWEDAYDIAAKSFAFTNHTVMAEALEKWPVHYLASMCPRVYMIIEEINKRFVAELHHKKVSEAAIRNMAIISDGLIKMCNMAVAVCYSVNGVASLHTDILKKDTFHDFYNLHKGKFNNKTNGITHRRFLMSANPGLTALLEEKIGDDFIKEPEAGLKKLLAFADDEPTLERMMAIKKTNKLALAAYVQKHNNLTIDPDSIIDVQIKRLHAYKRQTLNILRVVHLYQRMKADPTFRISPHTYIFGAKAAPSYALAKNTIEFINAVAAKVNADPKTNKFLKVVFIENYGVSSAEVIIPATDVSEQISTAGKEASGTSNMKFMMNGALTLGTLDGANVEISDLVGPDNAVIFGKKADELDKIRADNSYSSRAIYEADPEIKKAVDSLIDGTFDPNPGRFRLIYDDLVSRNDEFFVLLDFKAYLKASAQIDKFYQDRKGWAKKCLINVAYAGYFSSDRTIKEYNKDIWHLQPVKLTKTGGSPNSHVSSERVKPAVPLKMRKGK